MYLTQTAILSKKKAKVFLNGNFIFFGFWKSLLHFVYFLKSNITYMAFISRMIRICAIHTILIANQFYCSTEMTTIQKKCIKISQ